MATARQEFEAALDSVTADTTDEQIRDRAARLHDEYKYVRADRAAFFMRQCRSALQDEQVGEHS